MTDHGPRPEAVATPGSPLYYGLLFSDAARRDDLLALAALSAELQRSARVPAEAAVAGARLHWWREELHSLAAGSPSHPASRGIAHLLESGDLETADLDALLQAADGGESDLPVLLELMVTLAGFRDDTRANDLRYAAREIGHALAGQGRLECGGPGAETEAARHRDRIRAAADRLPASEIAGHRGLVVMAAIGHHRLDRLAAGRHTGRLGAVRELVVAWRTAHGASRGRLPGALRKRKQ